MTKELYFQNPNNYISREDGAWCSRFCKENWQEDVTHIMRIADDTVEKRFLFDLRWDMERTYEYVCFEKEVIWDYMPGDDPEFIFQFNRHQFFICLGQAYMMTGDEKYAETFAHLLLSWIRENPLSEETKKTTWRSIEAGIRAETWVKAMGYFKESPSITDQVIQEFMDCLEVHAEYLMTTYQYFQIKSNWGVIENRGLMEIALALPISDRTRDYLDTAISRLTEEIHVQLTEEGVHWEQSPMYHNEVFHCYIEVMRLAKRYDIELPAILPDKIRQMAYANLIWKKPNHCQVMQGDSDETDVRDLLAQSAYLFQDPVLKYGAYSCMDYDGAWDYLKEGILSYEKMESKEPDFLDSYLEDSGNLYIRSGWDEKADYFHFRSGFLGGGHGHSDKLHIDLVIHGEDILMDTGRYHYVPGEKRTWFKSAAGHNVPIIDDHDYLVCQDAWGVDYRTPAYMGGYRKKGNLRYIQGGHAGYISRGSAGVWINRKAVAIGTELYVIIDEFYTTEKHKFQQLFHFNNRGNVTLEGQTVHYKGEKAEAELTIVTGNCTMNLTHGMISRNYNQIETGKMLNAEVEKEGFCSIITIISGGASGSFEGTKARLIPVSGSADGTPLASHDAEAVEILWKGKKYIVIIAHKDIADSCDLLSAGGVKGLGSVIVFDAEKYKVGGAVLHW